MSQKHEISVRKAEAVETYSDDAFNRIIEAVTRGDMPVETVERLVALSERMMENRRRQAFAEAMARLQAKLPQINKYGQAKNSKFAKLEDIDVIIRPLLAEEGFSFSFDEESHSDKTVTFIAVIAHREGHSERKRLTVPIDTAASNREGKAIRPAIQDAGSTVSYARRYLIKMHLNLIEANEDTDGESRKKISEDQAKDLLAAVDEVGMDRAKFCVYMHVGEVGDIFEADLGKALTVIQAKRNENAMKAKNK